MIPILALLFVNILHGQTYFAGKSEKQIMELKKKAILKIEILDSKTNTTFVSAGFFTSKDGRFMTVHHDLRDHFLDNPNSKIRISNSEKEEFTDVVIEGCGNANSIDACTGKINNVQVKSYFEFNQTPRKEFENFSSIGHCELYQGKSVGEFNVKSGSIKGLTKSLQSKYGTFTSKQNSNTSLFEVSLPACVGDSGGPVFDPYTGSLLGMYTEAIKKKDSLNFEHYFAIDSNELVLLFNSNKDKSLIAIPKSRVHSTNPCFNPAPGTRQFVACQSL